MNALRRWYVSMPLACFLILPSGCSDELEYGVVEGSITLDGKPLTDVQVVFLPDPELGGRGRRSTSLTDEKGRYRISSDMGQAGAPLGFHRVCITDLKAGLPGVAPMQPDDNPTGPVGIRMEDVVPKNKPKSRFPEEYGDSARTPLRSIEVKPGAQVIDLDLKRVLP